MTLAHPNESPSQSVASARKRAGRLRAWVGMRWLAGAALFFAVTALALIATLHPSTSHRAEIALYLALSGFVALALGQGALWLADATRLGAVRLKLLLPPLLTTLVIGFSVILIARLMFIAMVDEYLLLGFLGFGAALALMVSYAVAQQMTRAIQRIEGGARRVAAGDYAYRVSEDEMSGAEELADLARWFNQMAANVQTAFEQRQAAEAERRQLIAALSHDLRTPLATVRAMIEAIDDGVVADPATIQRYQRAIRAEVGRLGALMDDLFDLSRLEAGAFTLHRERLALDDLLSDALEAMTTHAERRGVRLEGRIEGALPLVAVDARQVSRVLTNLLQNALQHTRAGDAILLHATTTRRGGATYARIAVYDSGAGIQERDLPHIFERTFRGEASRVRATSAGEALSGDGAGLGLTIARGIVEAHGGAITAVSPLPPEDRARLDPLRAATAPYRGAALIFTTPAISSVDEG